MNIHVVYFELGDYQCDAPELWEADLKHEYRNIECENYEVQEGILYAYGCNAEPSSVMALPLFQVKEWWVSNAANH